MDSVRKRPVETLLALVLLIGIGWFYAWTVAPEGFPDWVAKDGQGYYNLLTKGFMKGHLWLDKPVDPFLATLKDPWDPAQRAGHGLHDASYYHDHYYIYFGVSPALILFLPFRLLTGSFIDERAGTLMFAWVGLVASVGVLASIRRRYFPGASTRAFLAGVVALGLLDLMPLMLRRSSIWEVPIACGYACFMVALWALDRALGSRRWGRWLVLAGLTVGLAVGARPDYFPACFAVLGGGVFLARQWGGGFAGWRDSRWRGAMAAALVPLACVGVGLALYNWLRFGSLVEFGQRYQMSGSSAEHQHSNFGWSFLWYGLRLYWLEPAGWSHFFPYVLPITAPPGPPGALGIEDPYGILPNLPFVGWTLLLAGWAVGRLRQTPPLAVWGAGALIGVAGTAVAVSSFGGFTNRYMIDFLPGFVLLGAIGLLAASSAWGGRSWIHRCGGVLTAGLLVYSAGFSVLSSLRHNELLRVEHPALYRRMVHRWNWPSYLWDRWRHTEYGPIEMKVVFPRNRVGTNEPLIVTGWQFLADYFIVHYEDRDQLQFALVHTSGAFLLGDLTAVQPGAVHTIRVDLGSLYPPEGHPYFDAMDPEEARLRAHTFAVTLDGELQFARRGDFYDAIAPIPSIGTSADRPADRTPFSGKIVAWRRLPDLGAETPDRVTGASGALRVDVTFPAFTGVRNEPILSTGVTGRGDLIYVRYVGPRQVAFGCDHWGFGGPLSRAVEIDPGETQVIELDTAAIDSQNSGHLVLRLNGLTVFDVAQLAYVAPPGTIKVGRNAIGASTAVEAFTGRIVRTLRLRP